MVQTPSANDTFFGLDISDAKKSLVAFRRKISKRFLLLEFGVDCLTYGEAHVINEQVYYTKLNRVSIDQSAIERGTPIDEDAMASFLLDIIEEQPIWAHRVGITLPPQAALSKIIYLPKSLSYDEAIDHISNPSSSGFQFPISIENTDFDLIPLNSLPINETNQTKAYFLNSVPKKLIDNIIKTLSNAKLELHALDIAYTSLERLAINAINKLKENQVITIIELSLECTHFYIFSCNGPIHVTTLAAIRPFAVKEDYQGEISIEESTIKNEDYLNISELDLKVLFNEIRNELDKFEKHNKLEVCEIMLTGLNSSHPGIESLFKDRFKIKTSILRSMSSNDIADINHSQTLVMQDLNRLTGLGLTMIEANEIPREQIIQNSNISNLKNSIQDKSTKDIKDNNGNHQDKNNPYISKTSDSETQNYYPSKIREDTVNKAKLKTLDKQFEALSPENISFEEFLDKKNIEDTTNSYKSNDLITFSNKNSETSVDFGSNLQKSNSPSSDINPKLDNLNNVNDDLIFNDKETAQADDSSLDFDSDLQKSNSPSSDINPKLDNLNNDNDNDNEFNMPLN